MPAEHGTPEPDDAALLARIASGDPAAMEVFYGRWFPQFARLATRLIGNGPDGEDVAQDAVVKAITRAGTFRPGESPRTWLITIVRNAVCDLQRRKTVRRAVSVNEPDDDRAAVQVPDRAPTAGERAEARERAAAVHHALNQLTDDERAVILLRDYEGLSAADAARVLGITVEKVGSRLFRARKHLGALLQTAWPGLFPPGEL